MIKKSNYVALSFILMIFLTSCGLRSQLATVSPMQDIPTPIATALSTQPTTVETLMSPTSDIENGTPILPQNTPSLVSPVIQRCLGISKELSFEEVIKNGTVIADTGDSVLRLIDLDTGNSYEQPTLQKDPYRLSDMHLSPDKTALAYYESFLSANGRLEKTMIWVINAKADVLARVSLNPKDAAQFRWLDNDHLQIYSNKTYQDGTVEILNPYTGELQQLTNDLPNLFHNQYNDLIPWLVEYNRDLDKVVYFGLSDGEKSGPIVWNINERKVIWQDSDAGMIHTIPLWSPTKDDVAIVDDSGQLYIINRDGTINKLPKFEMQTSVQSFSWSPDGNFIAFWNVNDNVGQSKLMIYDIHANQVTDYCIVADGILDSDPIWSPDSQMFFTHMRIRKDDGSLGGSTILIDVIRNKAYSISREPKLLEWMNSIP